MLADQQFAMHRLLDEAGAVNRRVMLVGTRGVRGMSIGATPDGCLSNTSTVVAVIAGLVMVSVKLFPSVAITL